MNRKKWQVKSPNFEINKKLADLLSEKEITITIDAAWLHTLTMTCMKEVFLNVSDEIIKNFFIEIINFCINQIVTQIPEAKDLYDELRKTMFDD